MASDLIERLQPAARLAYIYRWDRHGRKGQPCRVTARSRAGVASFALPGFGRPASPRFNSIRVEFADGYKLITSGNAIRKAAP